MPIEDLNPKRDYLGKIKKVNGREYIKLDNQLRIQYTAQDSYTFQRISTKNLNIQGKKPGSRVRISGSVLEKIAIKAIKKEKTEEIAIAVLEEEETED